MLVGGKVSISNINRLVSLEQRRDPHLHVSVCYLSSEMSSIAQIDMMASLNFGDDGDERPVSIMDCCKYGCLWGCLL